MPVDSTDETPADRRKRVVARFKNALARGSCPDIEDHLRDLPERERLDGLAKLLQLDYRFRWDKGECPTVADYCRRFSQQEQLVEEELLAKLHQGGVRYVLRDKIGQGGFGTVFRARDTEL